MERRDVRPPVEVDQLDHCLRLVEVVETNILTKGYTLFVRCYNFKRLANVDGKHLRRVLRAMCPYQDINPYTAL